MDPTTSLSISLSLAAATSTSATHSSKSITIPATPRNRQLVGDVSHPNSARMFNHTPPRARIEVCGCVVLEGDMHLTATLLGENGYFRFCIVSDGCKWRKCADIAIASMMEEWSEVFSSSAVYESWSAEQALVRFLPVDRATGADLQNNVGRLLPENYHPFIHLRSLLLKMFAKAGYAVESQFLDSDFFRSLYMSGRWSEGQSGNFLDQMDFRALRKQDSEPTRANIFGRVFASPEKLYNTVGGIVDMPDATIMGSYDAGALSVNAATGVLTFTPTSEMMVAFDYLLRWRTEYRVASRTALKGLSEITFAIDDSVKIPLANTATDLRGGLLMSGYEYNLMIFDVVEGATYQLVAEEIVNPSADVEALEEGDTQTRILLTTQQRSTLFTNTFEGPLCNFRLAMITDGIYQTPLSDWAIYNGSVSEYGTVELEARVRTMPVECSPSSPVLFDTLYFGGGDEGMEITVFAGCSIQPVFYPHPSLNSTLLWGDVADHSFTGLDLLLRLQEMFNLRILTDNVAGKVIIEPDGEFVGRGEVVDLTGCVDFSQPILSEELGADGARTLRFAYRRGDYAVEEFCKQSGESFGEWSVELDNRFAKEESRSVVGSLFTPSIGRSGVVVEAPSAHLIVARNSHTGERVANLNFSPKILSYRGLKPLAVGEKWSWPRSTERLYPLLTFFDDGSLGGTPCSLLFEDRDGVVGLNRWWQGSIDSLNHSRRLRLHIALRPEQVEALGLPDGKGWDFRSHYLLCFEGERVLARLEEICNYDPREPSTEAVFVTL